MATSHLTKAITDLKAICAAISSIEFVAVFNNQVKLEGDGKTFNFPKPAILIEMQNPSAGVALLGSGVTVTDTLIWRFSIVHEELNAVDAATGNPSGTMDENLTVYSLRDAVKTALTGFKPTNCSELQYLEESQDYAHNNIYVYGISFKCSYVDTKGSGYDVDSTKWVTGTITNLNINLFDAWISGKTYVADGHAVLYPDANDLLEVYLCINSNTDLEFTPANWQKINAWEGNTSYTATTSYAAYQNHIYQCAVSNSDATFTPAKWTLIL